MDWLNNPVTIMNMILKIKVSLRAEHGSLSIMSLRAQRGNLM